MKTRPVATSAATSASTTIRSIPRSASAGEWTNGDRVGEQLVERGGVGEGERTDAQPAQ